jgi:2,4-dienoyl-CoA reductase-like NADH-dependent reductase (Old Yellow Enzyme family)
VHWEKNKDRGEKHMKKTERKTTRREFLKIGAGAAFGAVAGRSSLVDPGIMKSIPSKTREHFKVFSVGHIGKLRLKNRLVRAAAAEGASPDCLFSEKGAAIYTALGGGGVGLIISGHMCVTPGGRAEKTQTCIYNDTFIPSVHKIAAAAHSAGNGCKVVAQISHAGYKTEVDPVLPSYPTNLRVTKKVRILSTKEVEELVTHFIAAAGRARKAGFDGVEIHCAHNYLLSTFLSSYWNNRKDKYGGSPEKRVTIIREIISGIRRRIAADFPILLKMNCTDDIPGGIDIESFPALCKKIEKTGVDAIEVSGNDTCRKDLDQPEEQSYYLDYVKKTNLKIPVILTGGNKLITRLEEICQQGKVDFFGFARPLIREPSLPDRWLKGIGTDECTCISCNRCLGFLGKGPVTRCRQNS